jgi:hypothetical protein
MIVEPEVVESSAKSESDTASLNQSSSGAPVPSGRLSINIRQETIEEKPDESAVAFTRVASLLQSRNTVRKGSRQRGALTPTLPEETAERPLTNGPETNGSLREQRTMSLFIPPQKGIMGNPQFAKSAEHLTSSPMSISNSPFVPLVYEHMSIHVTETVNALLHNGHVTKVAMSGQVSIHLDNNYLPSGPFPVDMRLPQDMELQLAHFSIQRPATGSTYVVDFGAVHPDAHGRLPIATYQSFALNAALLPLIVTPQWKRQDGRLSLILTYERSPMHTGKLSNVSFLYAVGGSISSIVSKPVGIWNATKQRLLWNLDDASSGGTIIARFDGTELPSSPGPIAIRFTYEGSLAGMSATSDHVRTVVQAQTGKYYASASL